MNFGTHDDDRSRRNLRPIVQTRKTQWVMTTVWLVGIVYYVLYGLKYDIIGAK